MNGSDQTRSVPWGALFHERELPVVVAQPDQLLIVVDVQEGLSRAPSPLGLLSICILVMANGFVIVGKSAPASAANFDAELGKKLAYEDAIRQAWPLLGFNLRHEAAHRNYTAFVNRQPGRMVGWFS